MHSMTTPPMSAHARATTQERSNSSASRVILLPTGAIEQHGPHLPLGVDTWIATELCARVSAKLSTHTAGAVTVAEPLGYGCSWHHTAFAGTVSLRTSTFIALLADVCAGLHADNNRVIIINGHGGNRAPMQTATADLAAAGVPTWSVSYFELLSEVTARLFDDPNAAGHACAMETSMMLSLWPDLVRTELIPKGSTPQTWPNQHLYNADAVRTVRPFDQINPTGVIGRPELASAKAGEELVNTATDRLSDAVLRIWQTP